MKSIQSKTILLNVIGITAAITIATVIGSVTIANFGHENVEKNLSLLCESGKNNLNNYFKSVEQSTNFVSDIISDDLSSIPDADLNTEFASHVEDMKYTFKVAAEKTAGVYTFYYRIDPSISDVTGEKGFWFTNLDGTGFKEHEVTDLSDESKECRWFYITKQEGKPTWLSPYMTDNLDEYVISYNYPIYRKNSFVGVAGIEISYVTLGTQIKDLKVLESGYAFIVENKGGSIIYHPKIDLNGTKEEERPHVPQSFYNQLKAGKNHVIYSYKGVEKHAYIEGLSNDMSIVVAVPLTEINKTWLNLILEIVIVGIVLIGLSVLATILYSRKIIKPLRDLTKAAEEINNGNYNVKLVAKTDDEIGTLTTTVNKLINHLGEYIEDLNSLAYADSLTNVKNKGAFNKALEELQKRIDDPNDYPEFAIAILDCDNLKGINDAYGHDKGDVYLRNSCHLITRVFANSIVYRVGGDEFAVILEGKDYKNREKLASNFLSKSAEICSFAKEPWEKIRVSVGLAAYEPGVDQNSAEVVIHADHLMYSNKRARKAKK